MRSTLLLAALALIVSTLAAPTGLAARTSAPYNLGDWEDKTFYYLEAKSGTSGPYLHADPSSSSTPAYVVGDAASGTMLRAGEPSQNRPAPIEFKLEGTVKQTIWLNLSKPIVGALFWQSTGTSSGSHDAAIVLIELWADDALVGGDSFAFPPSGTFAGWAPMYFHFRPEVSQINAGQSLTFKVYRLQSLADFTIGTAGAQQSYVELRHFTQDPLAGALYVENRRILKATDVESQDEGATGLLGLGLLAIPLTLLSRRRSRVAALALALVSVTVFAGCMGSGTGAKDLDPQAQGPQATANITQADEAALLEAGVGAIEGQILNGDDAGIPVKDANVAILGTSLSAYTDAKGRFVFDQVAANTYTVRVDAKGFRSLEETIDVKIGKRVWLNVTLFKPGSGGPLTGGDGRAHLHDLWGDEKEKIIADKDFLPRNHNDLPPTANTWMSFYYCDCETVIPLPDILVLSGTSLVEVTFTWASGPAAPKELGLRITTAGNQTEDQKFVGRPSGTPFRIPIFPTEADPGHQKFSAWTFSARTPAHHVNTLNPTLENHAAGLVHVKIRIVKGIVPFEPAHRTFWQDGDELPIVSNTFTGATLCCGTYHWPGEKYWGPAGGQLVPPGTKEIRGELSWVHAHGAPAGYDWGVAYRSADISPSTGTWRTATNTPAGANKVTFTIAVTPEMTDQYYQTYSFWKFSPDDKLATISGPNTGYGVKWVLTAVAIKDPNYVESM